MKSLHSDTSRAWWTEYILLLPLQLFLSRFVCFRVVTSFLARPTTGIDILRVAKEALVTVLDMQ